MKLILRHTPTHRRRATHTASNHLQHLIRIRGTAPLLMLDHIDTELHLGLLHQLAIRTHALLRVGARKAVADQRRRVQARERDELPAVAELGEAADVRLLLVARHGRLPVEGGGEIVGESKRGHEVSIEFSGR